jgi:hypothetical protein
MATLPQFKQAQLARRSTSDIGRLAKQYRSQVDAITQQYQGAFGAYQAGVKEQMAPFEQAMSKYQNVDMPAYEAARSTYQTSLAAYNKQLEALAADPVVAKTGVAEYKVPRYGLFGLAGYTTKQESFTYYEPKPVPKFEEKAPTAPETPKAPTIAAFDDTQFKTQREQAESQFTREVGERRAAKLAAVGRRSSRPMLQGA